MIATQEKYVIRCRICRRPAPRPPTKFPLLQKILSFRYMCDVCKKRYGMPAAAGVLIGATVLMCLGLGGWLYHRQHPSLFEKDKDFEALNRESLQRIQKANGGGQMTAFEKMMSRPPKPKLDNAAILKLWKANVGADVIVGMIRSSTADYDLSPKAIIALHEEKVDQTIILAMIDTSYASK